MRSTKNAPLLTFKPYVNFLIPIWLENKAQKWCKFFAVLSLWRLQRMYLPTWSSDPDDEHVTLGLFEDPSDPAKVFQSKVEEHELHRLPAHRVVLDQQLLGDLSKLKCQKKKYIIALS